jgi:hypothetical protein
MISIALVVWLAIGFFMLRFEGGWLIMITDPHNTPRTWLALPSMFLCMVLWPINKWVARHCFLLSITNLPRPEVEMEDYSSEFPGRGSKVETLPDGKFLIDYDFNSMYWGEIRSLKLPDKKDD